MRGCIPVLGGKKAGRRRKDRLEKISSKEIGREENRAKIPMQQVKKGDLSMTSEKAELKQKLLKAYEQKLDEMLDEGYGKTLRDMENEVQETKNEIGKELIEAKLSLKKNEKPAGVSKMSKGVRER